jgi:putative DNA methylase
MLLTFVKQVRVAYQKMLECKVENERAQSIISYLAFAVDKLALRSNMFCTWATTSSGGRLTQAFGRQALEMVWDFVEANPFSNASGSFILALKDTAVHANILRALDNSAEVTRGSATNLSYADEWFDAIITDPPYYDNIFYADLSDFFFVWLKRTLGYAFPMHFSTYLTPKKREIVAAPWRNPDKTAAKIFYEQLLKASLVQARRILKPNSPLVTVYAHKTTAGWATLVDAMRFAGFIVTEAWPLSTELTGHRKVDTAALASSIFLIARRRENDDTGSYEREVRPELERIVRERVERLWAQGVTGADLVIACVGAGLRAFTRYARVEYANGEQVPADSFLAEVEGVAYRQGTIDGGEAIVFAYPQHVELDGPGGLTSGSNPLGEKQKGKYRLHDFTERGDDETLGLPHAGESAPLLIPAYLDKARPDVERLRIVAQTLAGQTLAGNGDGGGKSLVAARGAEAAALRKLTTNWRTLIEAHRGTLV